MCRTIEFGFWIMNLRLQHAIGAYSWRWRVSRNLSETKASNSDTHNDGVWSALASSYSRIRLLSLLGGRI